MKVSQRLDSIPMSGIRKMFALASPSSINLGLGEPDLLPPKKAIDGMTLAAVTLPYFRHILEAGLPKFVRFAPTAMGVCGKDKSDRAIAEEGLKALEAWMREIGLVMNITELGATEAMLPQIADSTFLLTGGYKTLTREEVI